MGAEFGNFKAIWGRNSGFLKQYGGRDSRLKICTGCGMAKITLGITGLRENLGWDDGIVLLSHL